MAAREVPRKPIVTAAHRSSRPAYHGFRCIIANVVAPVLQEDTPQPSDADVKVVSYDAIKVFVRIFSGFATEGQSAAWRPHS